MFVTLTLASLLWTAEFVYAGSSSHPLSSTSSGAKGGSNMGADGTAPVTHLAENKKKGRGGWVRWSVYCVLKNSA